jgi:hypothetical protein
MVESTYMDKETYHSGPRMEKKNLFRPSIDLQAQGKSDLQSTLRGKFDSVSCVTKPIVMNGILPSLFGPSL